MYGQPMPPTCKEATNPDTAFLSPELLPRLQSIQVIQEPLFEAHKVVLFSLQVHMGDLTKQVWPKPKPFTDFVLPCGSLEAANEDLQHLPPPTTLEAWGIRVEQIVDVSHA